MDEEAAIMLIMAFLALLVYASCQRIFIVRPLRKQVRKLELENARLTAASPTRGAPPEFGELHKINERLRVLERIAVEKEASLAREIEDLRATGS